MNGPAEGWLPQADGRLRYWDGEQWTDHFAPAAAPVKPVRPWFKMKRLMLPLAVLAVIVLVSAYNAGVGSRANKIPASNPPDAASASTPQPSTPEEPAVAATIEAAPAATSIDSCDYLLEPHYRFVGQSEITNTGNIDVKVKVDVTWKQVGAKAITRTQYQRINVGETNTVDFDVPASNSQIDQIQAYEGADNCKVVAAAVDIFGVAR